MKVFIAASLVLGLAACSQPVNDTNIVSAKAFLTGLYSHYDGKTLDFSPLVEHAPEWFDPDMIALMAKDQKLAGDEVGALDNDPVCDCQDYGKLSAEVTVLTADAQHARASAVVTETDPSVAAEDRKPRSFSYDLVRVDGQWRIHDIGTQTTPSLRELFIRSNTQLAASASSN